MHCNDLRMLNNLCPIVITSGLEIKRKRPLRWSHLALRKPASSRDIAGRYGGRIAFQPGLLPNSGTRARVSKV